MSKVVKLDNAATDKALEGLNRLTGLVFESWPESLVGAPEQHPATNESVVGDQLVLTAQSIAPTLDEQFVDLKAHRRIR